MIQQLNRNWILSFHSFNHVPISFISFNFLLPLLFCNLFVFQMLYELLFYSFSGRARVHWLIWRIKNFSSQRNVSWSNFIFWVLMRGPSTESLRNGSIFPFKFDSLVIFFLNSYNFNLSVHLRPDVFFLLPLRPQPLKIVPIGPILQLIQNISLVFDYRYLFFQRFNFIYRWFVVGVKIILNFLEPFPYVRIRRLEAMFFGLVCWVLLVAEVP